MELIALVLLRYRSNSRQFSTILAASSYSPQELHACFSVLSCLSTYGRTSRTLLPLARFQTREYLSDSFENVRYQLGSRTNTGNPYAAASLFTPFGRSCNQLLQNSYFWFVLPLQVVSAVPDSAVIQKRSFERNDATVSKQRLIFKLTERFEKERNERNRQLQQHRR
jgi:hypothetical protein